MDARIAAARAALGTDVVMLGHHYQRDEVIRFADYVGDSYKLSKVAERTGAKYMVFWWRSLYGGRWRMCWLIRGSRGFCLI